MSAQQSRRESRRAKRVGLVEAVENLAKGYDLGYALQYNQHTVLAALQAFERLVADLEEHDPNGAPVYARKALVFRGV